MPDVVLKVGSNEYSQFASIHIRKNVNELAGAFALSLENIFSQDPTLWEMNIGDACSIELNTVPIITGYIEDMPIFNDEDDQIMHIIGRDNTGDLIDCPHDSDINEWKDSSIKDIITNLCEPFGIDVDVEESAEEITNTIIDTFKASETEKVSSLIYKICRDYGLFALALGDGALTLTTSGQAEDSTDPILNGFNIIRTKLNQNNMNRFKKYTVKGYGTSTDEKGLSDYIEPSGSFTDSVIDRHRPKVMFSDSICDSSICESRAKFESRIVAGYSRGIEAEISNHIQEDGTPWLFNSLADIIDERYFINEKMLIASVEYIFNNEDSEITKVFLVDKDTFILSDDPIEVKTIYDG